MKQYAIRWTKENTSVVAEPLTYDTPETLLRDYGYMFERHETVVVGIDVISTGETMIGYVKSEPHFAVNSDHPDINTETYTFQYEF